MARALDALKTVKEQLDQNYTSYQLLTVLDALIWKAIRPVVYNSNYMDRVLANVLGWSSSNPRRKLSSLPRERFATYVVAYLAADAPETKMRVLKRMRLERNIFFHVIDRFESITRSLHPMNPVDSAVINALSANVPQRLWYARRDVQYWSHHASRFKGMILEKYMRYVMMEAQRFHKHQRINNPHLVFDIEDIAQNFILAVSKAVDKCDAQRGTLTSYIQNWIKDAKGNPALRGEYGLAYSIPASQRRQIASSVSKTVNIGVSMQNEDLEGLESHTNTEGEYERTQTLSHIRLLIKRADPAGISRMFHGVEEYLEPHELQQFKHNKE